MVTIESVLGKFGNDPKPMTRDNLIKACGNTVAAKNMVDSMVVSGFLKLDQFQRLLPTENRTVQPTSRRPRKQTGPTRDDIQAWRRRWNRMVQKEEAEVRRDLVAAGYDPDKATPELIELALQGQLPRVPKQRPAGVIPGADAKPQERHLQVVRDSFEDDPRVSRLAEGDGYRLVWPGSSRATVLTPSKDGTWTGQMEGGNVVFQYANREAALARIDEALAYEKVNLNWRVWETLNRREAISDIENRMWSSVVDNDHYYRQRIQELESARLERRIGAFATEDEAKALVAKRKASAQVGYTYSYSWSDGDL
jgi:hypothetical protein